VIKVNIYLTFPGTCEEALDSYKSVFGGEFISLVRFDDKSLESANIPKKDKNKIAYIGFPVGKDVLINADDTLEMFGPKPVSGTNISIVIHPDGKKEADRIFGALSTGGKIKSPMTEQSYGYIGGLTDRFGIGWTVWYRYPEVK
jgi:PhnB protein